MKQWIMILGAILAPLIIFPCDVLAETLEVGLRIRNDKSDEDIIKRENLVRIKQFILQQGKRETYCNMYSNNPAYHTVNFDFYLNPDTGQRNINCDRSKSDFHDITIRVPPAAGKKNQYRHVRFADQDEIGIVATWPTDDLTVADIRGVVVDALKEILAEIKKKRAEQTIGGDSLNRTPGSRLR